MDLNKNKQKKYHMSETMIEKQCVKLKVPVYFVKNNSHYKKLNAFLSIS